MEKLIASFQHLLIAGWEVVISFLAFVVPWTPLIAWIAFWLLAVNWEKLYPVLTKGAAVGVSLIALMMILIWGVVAPPQGGVHHLLGLTIVNYAGKTVYVTMLVTIALLCGSVQLSGALGSLVSFPEDGHGEHGDSDHGHGDHGHGDSSNAH